jgi:polysaccharide export outer membrane protein
MHRVKVLMLFMLVLVISPGLAHGSDYIIGPGDTINISVWGNKDLNSTVTVRPDGKISFPLIGEVVANGLTPLQLRKVVTQKLSEYVNNPEVTVDIKGMKSFNVYVYGNIAKAGSITIKDNTNLLQFFSLLGPLPDHIDLKQSFLVRNNKKLKVDFYKLLKQGDLSQNQYLKPNDTIFFKEKPKKPPLPEVSPFETRIRVIGEVRNQGVFNYEEGMTVLDAILRAGGTTPYARPSATIITRRKGDKIEEIRVDLEAIYQGAIDQNVQLMPGDIVSVPESLF